MFFTTKALLFAIPRAPVQNIAKRGLFHGKHILFGNMRSHSEHKVRRTWKPNVQTKRFFSPLLDKMIRIKVTTRALRTIDKLGGIDEYLLKTRKEYLGYYDDSVGVILKDAVTDQYNRVVASDEQYLTNKTRPGNRRLVDVKPKKMVTSTFLDNVFMPKLVKTRTTKKNNVVTREILNTRTGSVYKETIVKKSQLKVKAKSVKTAGQVTSSQTTATAF